MASPIAGAQSFLSTLSLRRATRSGRADGGGSSISIHALLAESDLAGPSGPAISFNFYPRSPCGERPLAPKQNATQKAISIHALLAESDAIDVFLAVWAVISIHALLAESDKLIAYQSGRLRDFYPRSPCGERRRR